MVPGVFNHSIASVDRDRENVVRPVTSLHPSSLARWFCYTRALEDCVMKDFLVAALAFGILNRLTGTGMNHH